MKCAIVMSVLIACFLARTTYGMAIEQIGPDKPSQLTHPQPHWFKGIVEVPRHPSRVYSIWINGNENFHFKATPDQVNELIDLFSKARLRDHAIRLKAGTNSVKSFKGEVFEPNVSLQILDGIALYRSRGVDSTETHEPSMTIYVGDDESLLNALRLPENVAVHCEIEGVEIKRQSKPARKAWQGHLQSSAGGGVVDFETGVSTHLTLWDNTSVEGIPLGSVRNDGSFTVVFSDAEMASLHEGKSWITVTTGNYLVAPKASHPRLPATGLVLDQEKAVPQRVDVPDNYYHGRILFDDGSAPVLHHEPWPGAEIAVSFPYAGQVKPDAEGYFKIFLEPEQLAALKERKPDKNIYVPMAEQGRSRAVTEFPPELLSRDKTNAGVVKIAKPDYLK